MELGPWMGGGMEPLSHKARELESAGEPMESPMSQIPEKGLPDSCGAIPNGAESISDVAPKEGPGSKRNGQDTHVGGSCLVTWKYAYLFSAVAVFPMG